MKLIADSGSTKTDWAIIDDGKAVRMIATSGINPYYLSSESIREIITRELVPHTEPGKIREIFFYGAGCSTENKTAVLKEHLKEHYHDAGISINHDILGAARALNGRKPGIACILGTGSNSCVYDGEKVVGNISSLGFIFADEGSGAYLGKNFLFRYFRKQLPQEIQADFENEFHLSLENILDAVYNQPKPGRFLASFSKFMARHKEHPYIRTFLRDAFSEFLKNQVMQYPEYEKYPVNFTGSIAFVYSDILHEAAVLCNINIGRILKSPIEGLIEYHTKGL